MTKKKKKFSSKFKMEPSTIIYVASKKVQSDLPNKSS